MATRWTTALIPKEIRNARDTGSGDEPGPATEPNRDSGEEGGRSSCLCTNPSSIGRFPVKPGENSSYE